MVKCVIVDDNQSCLDICKRHVHHVRGCVAKTFISPIDALKYIKDNTVDLIILDINMPLMTGSVFVDNLKMMKLESEPAIMMCSAESGSDVILDLMGKGVIGYVVKPYEADTLKKQIRHIRNETRPELIPANEMWSLTPTATSTS